MIIMNRTFKHLGLTFIVMINVIIKFSGCIRRIEDDVAVDYEEIDRKSPPIFINNTMTEFNVADASDVTMECQVRNLGDRAVSWIRKSDLHILTMGKVVFTNDKRFSVTKVKDNWILGLKAANVNDSGIYECQVNTEPKRSKAYRLQVVVSNAKIQGDRDVFVHLDSDINLTCKALSSPDPPKSVTWLKDGIRIDSLLARGGISVVTEARRRTSRLLVSKVTADDAGNYTCAPSNSKIDSVMVHVIAGADPRAMASTASSISLHFSSSLGLVSASLVVNLRKSASRVG